MDSSMLKKKECQMRTGETLLGGSEREYSENGIWVDSTHDKDSLFITSSLESSAQLFSFAEESTNIWV